MSDRQDAIDALTTILGAATNAESGATQLQGTWCYHTQYNLIDMANLPVLIVCKVDGEINQRGIHTHGVMYDRWRAWAILYLAYGNPEHPSEAGAAAIKLERGWITAFSAALADNITLSDTVTKIGEPDGERLKLFDYMADYWQWNAQPYWGIRLEIPIMQYVEQSTSV